MLDKLFGDSIWHYTKENEMEYIIKWIVPTEPGSGKIWSVICTQDIEFQIDVKDFHIETPSYSKGGKIYANGSLVVIDDEAHIV